MVPASSPKPQTSAAKLIAARIEEMGVLQVDVYNRLGRSQGWWWRRMNTDKPFPFDAVDELARALKWAKGSPESKRLEAAINADHGRNIGAAAPYVQALELEVARLKKALAEARKSPPV